MISVCIASYNGGKYIRRQLESILIQLDQEDEVVISDDGSTDNTAAEVADLNDERVRFVSHAPAGITANFENAVRHAKGDFIFFADQDDEWFPGKVQTVLRTFATSGCAVVQHDAVVVDGNGVVIFPSWAEQRGIRKGIFLNLVKTCYIGCCMAFRRELLDFALPFRGNNNACLHDEWVGFVAEHHGGICYIPEKLIKYCRHEGTVSQINRPGPIWKQVYKRIMIVWYLVCFTLSKK